MSARPAAIERIVRPVAEADIVELADLLVDAVDSGSAVSFLAPLPTERAVAWWRRLLDESGDGFVLLVARDADGIAGSVQLHPARAPNQPHRADVAKLIVHRRCRRLGIGTRLMEALEDEARRAGLGLLTLDTKRGDAAEGMYRRLGWIAAGSIPGYALDADGTAHDTVVFYKALERSAGGARAGAARTDERVPVPAPGGPGVTVHGLTPILNVSDLNDSFAWFEKLGWRKGWEWGTPATFGGVRAGKCEIFLCRGAQGGRGRGDSSRTFGPGGDETSDKGSWMSVWVEDVDAVHERCLERGLDVTWPPTDMPWGVREMHVRHPDGHVFRISRGIE